MGSGRGTAHVPLTNTSFREGCLYPHMDSCGALLDSPVVGWNAFLAHTSFPVPHNL